MQLAGLDGRAELRLAITEAGYPRNIMPKSLEALENGHREQIPVAVATEKAEASKVWRHFEKIISRHWAIEKVSTRREGDIDFSGRVQTGDRLLTITSSPQIMLQYPDGRKMPIRRINTQPEHIDRIVGKNTRRGDKANSIIAAIYGIISVYPVIAFRNVAKLNREFGERSAVEVEHDVLPGATVETPSNLIVNGMIKSAHVSTGGNIHCVMGIDNNIKTKTAVVQAGQNVYTRSIQNYDVWVGGNLVVDQTVTGSKIRCLRQMVVPEIASSEILVGHRLFADTIRKGTAIILGEMTVEARELHQRRSFFLQRAKKLRDLENDLLQDRMMIENSKHRAALLLRRMRRSEKFSQKSDIILARFAGNLEMALERYQKHVGQFKDIVRQHEIERLELAFLEQQLEAERFSEVVVTGTVEAGVVFQGPNGSYTVRKAMAAVTVQFDHLRGAMEFRPLHGEDGDPFADAKPATTEENAAII